MQHLLLRPDSENYGQTEGSEVIAVELDGGAGRYRRDKVGATRHVNVSWTMDPDQYKYWRAFWNTATKRGALPFLCDLVGEDGTGPATYTCYFVPGSVSMPSQQGLTYIQTATLEVVPPLVSGVDDQTTIDDFVAGHGGDTGGGDTGDPSMLPEIDFKHATYTIGGLTKELAEILDLDGTVAAPSDPAPTVSPGVGLISTVGDSPAYISFLNTVRDAVLQGGRSFVAVYDVTMTEAGDVGLYIESEDTTESYGSWPRYLTESSAQIHVRALGGNDTPATPATHFKVAVRVDLDSGVTASVNGEDVLVQAGTMAGPVADLYIYGEFFTGAFEKVVFLADTGQDLTVLSAP